MMAGFDVELTYVARTARDGVRSTADLPELLPGPTSWWSSSRSPTRPPAWWTPRSWPR